MEDCKPVDTPSVTGQELTIVDEESKDCDVTSYRSLVGKLLFAANTVRCDISYIVGVLSRYLQRPKEIHLTSAKRVLRYLKNSMDWSLKYQSGYNGLVGYSDADWANDKLDRKSTTGLLFKMAGAPITWRSKKQPTVAVSTAEAEYMGLSEAVKESLWLKNLLGEFDIQVTPIKLYQDNQSCIQLSDHPSGHHRTKHIDIRHHHIRDHVIKKDIEIEYLETKEMIADMFTEGLPRPQFTELRNKLNSRTI